MLDLTAWKADVPEGKYRITLLLSEPFSKQQRKNTERVFDIYLNGRLWQHQMNIEKEVGVQSAVVLDKIIEVKTDEGIKIEFKTVSDKTLLNGVSLQKL